MFQDDGSSSVTSAPVQIFPSSSSMSISPSPYPWLKELKSEERGLCLIHLLLTCAKHVASGNFEHANIALDQISHLASPEGDTMQRIASYFAEALANRILKTWPGIYKALHSTRISLASESIMVRKMFFEYFPYLKIAFVITNQVIIEAMEGEKIVHVIDLNAAEPTQWRALLRDLSARPEGPPHLRITGVHQQKEVLDQMARILIEEAEKLDIPFQFNPIVSTIENLDVEKLNVKTGEALAISSVLQFHSLLAPDDEVVKSKKNSNGVHLQRVLQVNPKDLANGYSLSQDTASSSPLSSAITSTKIEGFLSALRGLSPKVMVVVEQDSDHNKSGLMERLSESLYFYAALFDCLESTLPRTSMERLKVEKMLFGEEIKNIIACEGGEREREMATAVVKSVLNSIKERGLLNFARELRQEGFLNCLTDGNLLQTKIHNIGATLVGVDKFGNKYYQKLENTQYGRHRWVEYASKDRYNASQVPPEWHGWLHFVTDHTGDELLMLKPKRYGLDHKENSTGEGDEYIYHSKGHTLHPGQRDWTRYQSWQPTKTQ